MELLAQIQATIDRLQANPAAVDISEILDQLSAAYNLTSQGLQRSDAASRLPAALKQVDALSQENEELLNQLAALRLVHSQLKSLEPVLQYLRDRLTSLHKLHAPHTYNLPPDFADTASPDQLVSTLANLEAEIAHQWRSSSPPTTALNVAIDRYPKNNIDLYRTGA